MKIFKEYLLESILQILWKQWASLGIYASIEEEYRYNIDPESLLCATCAFGRFDQRLFDEVLAWLCEYGYLLNIDRLKAVLKNFKDFEVRTLGAVAEHLALKEKKRKWERVVHYCEKIKIENGERKYFLTKDFNSLPLIGKPDKIFRKWGLLRPEVDLPQTNHMLDFERPSNIIFKLRSFFGVSTRADICMFLLLCGEHNSLQISKKINFNQRNVYKVLNQLQRSGFLEKRYTGQRSLYFINKDQWNAFLKFDGDITYIVWSKLFSALSYLLNQVIEHPEFFKDAYMASSKLREIAEKFIPEIESSYLIVKTMNSKRGVGESFTVRFEDYVKKILDRL
jgi:hypothetical protein